MMSVADVPASFVVRQFAQGIERERDQIHPRRPVRVQRRFGVAGELSDPRVRHGVGTFIGQHLEGCARDIRTGASHPCVLTGAG